MAQPGPARYVRSSRAIAPELGHAPLVTSSTTCKEERPNLSRLSRSVPQLAQTQDSRFTLVPQPQKWPPKHLVFSNTPHLRAHALLVAAPPPPPSYGSWCPKFILNRLQPGHVPFCHVFRRACKSRPLVLTRKLPLHQCRKGALLPGQFMPRLGPAFHPFQLQESA